jgi:hypothetical protein
MFRRNMSPPSSGQKCPQARNSISSCTDYMKTRGRRIGCMGGDHRKSRQAGSRELARVSRRWGLKGAKATEGA